MSVVGLDYNALNSLERVVRSAVQDARPTLREYFAAHAPAEPQSWFQPVMLTERPSRSSELDEDGYPVNLGEIFDWDEERKKQRLIQWPWAWADAVLSKARQS